MAIENATEDDIAALKENIEGFGSLPHGGGGA